MRFFGAREVRALLGEAPAGKEPVDGAFLRRLDSLELRARGVPAYMQPLILAEVAALLRSSSVVEEEPVAEAASTARIGPVWAAEQADAQADFHLLLLLASVIPMLPRARPSPMHPRSMRWLHPTVGRRINSPRALHCLHCTPHTLRSLEAF